MKRIRAWNLSERMIVASKISRDIGYRGASSSGYAQGPAWQSRRQYSYAEASTFLITLDPLKAVSSCSVYRGASVFYD